MYQGWDLNPAVYFGGHVFNHCTEPPQTRAESRVQAGRLQKPSGYLLKCLYTRPGRLVLDERERILAAGGDMGLVPTPLLF